MKTIDEIVREASRIGTERLDFKMSMPSAYRAMHEVNARFKTLTRDPSKHEHIGIGQEFEMYDVKVTIGVRH